MVQHDSVCFVEKCRSRFDCQVSFLPLIYDFNQAPSRQYVYCATAAHGLKATCSVSQGARIMAAGLYRCCTGYDGYDIA